MAGHLNAAAISRGWCGLQGHCTYFRGRVNVLQVTNRGQGAKSDFSGDRLAWYWTEEEETAEHYRI